MEQLSEILADIHPYADGIAVMSGVLNADEPLAAIKSYQKEVKMEMC